MKDRVCCSKASQALGLPAAMGVIAAILVTWTLPTPLGPKGAAAEAPEGARSSKGVEVLRDAPSEGRFLSFGGKPIFIIGDSVTQGWAESGEDFDQEAWIRALSARGIRALLLWAFIGPADASDARLGYDAPEILPWARTGPRRWDLLRWNEAYFGRLRALCRLAEEREIVVIITVFDGWTKTRFEAHPFNEANGGPLRDRSQFVDLADAEREMPETFDPRWSWKERNQFFQERLAARLIEATRGLGNVIFELFNEGEWYDAEKRRRHEVRFLAFFRARCRNLLVSNADHIRGAGRSTGADRNAGADSRRDPRADIISHHRPNWSPSSRAAESFEHYRRELEASPPRPFLFSEPVPEFDGARDCEVDAITRLLWGTALAGAGFLVQNDASFGFNPKAKIAGNARLRDAMLDREGACSRFFNAMGVGWVSMRPDPRAASTGVAMARPGQEYVVYAEEGTSFTMDLSGQAGADFEGRFYDPRTGDLHPALSVPGGGGTRKIAKPDVRDWVFWLRRRAEVPGPR
jgi:hypothetical protein